MIASNKFFVYHVFLDTWRKLQKRRYVNFVLAFISCILLFKYPIAILLALAISVIFNYKGAARSLGFAVLLFIVFLINSTKAVDGDLETYLNLQKVFSQMNPWAIFFDNEDIVLHSGSFRNSEFAGYFIYWFVARYISEGKTAFEILSLSLIYIPGIIAIAILSKHLNLSKVESSIAYLSFLFFCVNPALVTHVARQYAAGSFFLLAMALFIAGRKLGSFISLFLAIFIHNSIAIVFCVGLMVYYLYMRNRSRIGLYTVLNPRIWTLLFLTVASLLVFLAQNPNLILQDDGRISYFTVAVDSALLIYLTRRGYVNFSSRSVSVISSVSFGLILLSVLSLMLDMKIFSLRFYFYVELLRFFGIVLMYRTFSCSFQRYKTIFAHSLVMLFVAHFFLKLQLSPFVFAAQGLLLPFTGITSLGNALIIY